MNPAEREQLQGFFETDAYALLKEALQKLEQSVSGTADDYVSVLEWLASQMQQFRQDSNAMGYFDLANLAYQLEGESRRLMELGAPAQQEDISRFAVYLENLQLFLDFYNQKSDQQQDSLYKVRKSFKVSNEVIELYLVEVKDHIELFQRTLIDLDRKKINAKTALEEIYRAVHSVKGDSNALGFFKIAELSHKLENKLNDLLNLPELSEEQLNQLFEWGEQFKDVVEQEVAEKSQQRADAETEAAPAKEVIVETVPPATSIPALDEAPLEDEQDDEIIALYGSEAAEILVSVNEQLNTLSQQQGDPKQLLETIYRSIHTLKGNSNALGFEQVGTIAANLENSLSQYKKSPEKFDTLQLQATQKTFQELVQALEKLTQSQILNAPVAAAPTVVEAPEEVDEVTLLYRQEAEEILETVSKELLALESGERQAKEGISSIYRAVHTLKGNSNALGFEQVGDVAHTMESALSALRKSPETLNSESLQSLFNQFEALQKSLPGKAQTSLTHSIQHAPVTATPSASQAIVRQAALPETPELDEITLLYLDEAQEILLSLSGQLLELESGSLSYQEGIESIYRGIHTLKGNSNALGLESVGELAHIMESELSQMRKSPEDLNSSKLQTLFAQLEDVQTAVLNLKPGSTDSGGDSRFEASISYITDDADDGIDEITQLFADEAKDILGSISQQLLQLEANELPHKEGIESIYRAFHTLKGNANALGFETIGQLAHEAEHDLQKLRKQNKKPGPKQLERLFKFHADITAASQKIVAEASQQAEKESQRQTQHRKKSVTQEIRITHERHQAVQGNTKIGNEWRKDKGILTTGSGNKKLERVSAEQKQRVQRDDETIRVSVRKIDQLINLSDELLIHKISYEQKLTHLRELQSLLNTFRHQIRHDTNLSQQHPSFQALRLINERIGSFEKELKEDINGFSLTVDEIQYHSRNTRMLPCTVLLEPLRLVVRSTAQKLGKQVDFLVLGEDTEIDRLMVERLKDPLAHLIRNGIDHGIETPEERKATDKPPRAQLIVEIMLSGNQIVFQIQDDGRGLNYDKIRAKAVKAGLYTEEQVQSLSEVELNRLIFSSGFSTADRVSDISGRGVGLDVVRATIEALNGQIEVLTEPGKGTQFKIMLPVTLTTFDAFLIRLGQRRYAVPSALITATRLIEQTQLRQHQNQWIMDWNGQPIPVQALHGFLNMDSYTFNSNSRILLMSMNQSYLGLLVDEVLEARELVMKPLGSQLKKVKHIAGATILGEGEPVVILDLHDVFYAYYQDQQIKIAAEETELSGSVQKATKVLVVDDSVTTRTLEKNILQAAGFEVEIATNGKEAQTKVPLVNPDIIITDCEMPVMDGYAFTSWVKKESEFAHIPMIMVTSLAAEEFKRKAFEAGINDFVVKGQFKQGIFLDKINHLLKSAAKSH